MGIFFSNTEHGAPDFLVPPSQTARTQCYIMVHARTSRRAGSQQCFPLEQRRCGEGHGNVSDRRDAGATLRSIYCCRRFSSDFRRKRATAVVRPPQKTFSHRHHGVHRGDRARSYSPDSRLAPPTSRPVQRQRVPTYLYTEPRPGCHSRIGYTRVLLLATNHTMVRHPQDILSYLYLSHRSRTTTVVVHYPLSGNHKSFCGNFVLRRTSRFRDLFFVLSCLVLFCFVFHRTYRMGRYVRSTGNQAFS